MKRFEFRDSSELYTYIHALFVPKGHFGIKLGLFWDCFQNITARELRKNFCAARNSRPRCNLSARSNCSEEM